MPLDHWAKAMPFTLTILWGVVGLLTLLGGYLVVINYLCLVAASQGKHSSMLPLLGGLFLAIALFICPLPHVRQYAWLPFVLDLGCLPLLIECLRFFVIQKGHKR